MNIRNFIFRPRFNYFDTVMVFTAIALVSVIGWWVVLYILVMSAVSVIGESKL